jgi:hypothetical protein
MLNNMKILSLRKKIGFSLLFTGLAAFSFASMGGGGTKPKASVSSALFTPIRATSVFTLKAGPSYRGSNIFNNTKVDNFITFNSVITYQKGNTTYILPYKHRVSISAGKSNLQVVNLRVNIHH